MTDIGEAEVIVVNDEGKFASAHNHGRTFFGQRLADAGLPPRDLQAVTRYANLATTEKYYLRHRAIEQAERIAMYLGTHQQVNKKRLTSNRRKPFDSKVPEEGLDPSRGSPHWILNPARLPIPPLWPINGPSITDCKTKSAPCKIQLTPPNSLSCPPAHNRQQPSGS